MDSMDQDGNMDQKPIWRFRLYIMGQSAKSVRALANLKRICDHYLDDAIYEIEAVDLQVSPELALLDQVIIIPTLVKLLPEPVMKLYGDLSNTEKVLEGLEFPRPQ